MLCDFKSNNCEYTRYAPSRRTGAYLSYILRNKDVVSGTKIWVLLNINGVALLEERAIQQRDRVFLIAPQMSRAE